MGMGRTGTVQLKPGKTDLSTRAREYQVRSMEEMRPAQFPVPDRSPHYVPFTYVGTIDAYSFQRR